MDTTFDGQSEMFDGDSAEISAHADGRLSIDQFFAAKSAPVTIQLLQKQGRGNDGD